MNTLRHPISLFCMCIFASCYSNENSQGENFLSKVDQNHSELVDESVHLTFFNNPGQPLESAFTGFPWGQNRPEGWVREMMLNDLQQGIVGALDDLYPGISADDIFCKNRRGGIEDVPEMGDLVLTGEPWEASIMWWNSETIGNWWDGFMGHAFLTGDEPSIEQAHAIVSHLLHSQDDDGYIGIYKPNLRYQHDGANGELWAQTTALRALLSYYEYTGNPLVLEAVERAMDLTIKSYGPEGRNPFKLNHEYGGATHGLMMTDVCDTLFRITGNEKYRFFACFLYRSFSSYSINNAFNDMRFPRLMDREKKFTGHGVHTYEHLRALLQVYYATGYPQMKAAWENALYKLAFTLLPGGAGHGAEWISALIADPDFTATEYCAMLELRNSLLFAAEKTANSAFAEYAELLTFNGMMGFRNRDGTAITYNKTDNCYVLDGQHHSPNGTAKDVRYKYSPTHSDPAVCCVPNYGRNFPYYLHYMWMKQSGVLVAMLYGPSIFRTEVEGVTLAIEQETGFPLSDEIVMKLTVSGPLHLSIKLRRPSWCRNMQVSCAGATIQAADEHYIELSKTWETGDSINIRFENVVEVKQFRNGDSYFQRGPLIFAKPISHREVTIKTYEQRNFRDYFCFPTEKTYSKLALYPESESINDSFFIGNSNVDWYENMPCLHVKLLNVESASEEKVTLQPMGSTILRQVTFKNASIEFTQDRSLECTSDDEL